MVAEVRAQVTYSFVHGDYHSADILWQGRRITVIDRVNACRGPAGIDVVHRKVNFAQLYGIAATELFLEAYQKRSGKRFYSHSYWNLLFLTNILGGLNWEGKAYQMNGFVIDLMNFY